MCVNLLLGVYHVKVLKLYYTYLRTCIAWAAVHATTKETLQSAHELHKVNQEKSASVPDSDSRTAVHVMHASQQIQ